MNEPLIIPKELVTKFKNEITGSNVTYITDTPILHFSDTEDILYNFCVKWSNTLSNYYGFYNKATIGKYEGIFPLSIDDEKREVCFSIDFVGLDDWKHWFKIDEDLCLNKM